MTGMPRITPLTRQILESFSNTKRLSTKPEPS